MRDKERGPRATIWARIVNSDTAGTDHGDGGRGDDRDRSPRAWKNFRLAARGEQQVGKTMPRPSVAKSQRICQAPGESAKSTAVPTNGAEQGAASSVDDQAVEEMATIYCAAGRRRSGSRHGRRIA